MQFSILFASQAFLAITSAIAIPASAAYEAATAKIDAPANIGVFVCSEPNWKGTCEHLFMSTGICYDVKGKMENDISCIGPDKPASGCYAYTGAQCTGNRSASLKFPGISTLQYAPGFDNKVKSFICY